MKTTRSSSHPWGRGQRRQPAAHDRFSHRSCLHTAVAGLGDRHRLHAVSTATEVLPLDPARLSVGELDELDFERGYCAAFEPYSPDRIREAVLSTPSESLKVLARVLEIATSFGTLFINMKLDYITGTSNERSTVVKRASELREMLTRLGPAFIKVGQVLANRPDIVREDYMNELCILQDDVPQFPDEEAFRIIEEDLGQPIENIFTSISECPVAAASLGQVYKAVLRETGEEVAVKVQRPDVEPNILRDLFIFRTVAGYVNWLTVKRLGCNAALIVDEFGEKILEELDYTMEARNIKDFYRNFIGDTTVKIPWVRTDLCGRRVLVMEWINGIRCTEPDSIRTAGIDVPLFIKRGVVGGLRQLLEFGLFHGDPHPGNIFALPDGRIAYVDFGNVAELSQQNKQVLIDAVVHAVNEDYHEMARDFIKLGFLAPGTDITPIVPALENIWADSMGQSLSDFNFRTVTSKFNELVYQYPIRIPERFSLVIRSLLTQEGICLTLEPDFHFLEVAYPYVARRLLTDEDPTLRDRLIQVLFQDGKFQWKRLENLIVLAREGPGGEKLDLTDTIRDALRVLLTDDRIRTQLLQAFTEDNRLHVREVAELLELLQDDIDMPGFVQEAIRDLPSLSRSAILAWSDRVLAS